MDFPVSPDEKERQQKIDLLKKEKKFQSDTYSVTKITDPDNKGIFDSVDLLSVSVEVSSKLSSHPLENGIVITDNKIENQAKITVQAVCAHEQYDNVFKNINYARKRAKLFVIQTKVDTYYNMCITDCTYEESAKHQKSISFEIQFIEQQLVKSAHGKLSYLDVKEEKDIDTPNRSVITPEYFHYEYDSALKNIVGV